MTDLRQPQNFNTKQSSSGITPQSRLPNLPLSLAQQRFWFLEQVEQGEGVFCIPVLLRLQGNLDIAALERSFQTLIRRHEILRTSFPDKEGTPTQVIAPGGDYTLPLIEVKGQTEHERLDALFQLVDESVLQPFDLRHGPLMKTTLFRVQESEHVLLVAFHHIVSDGWSMGIFNQELVAAYYAYSNCREPHLPPLPFQYADYTLWQREWLQGERLDELLTYWRRQLSGAPTVLNLPTDHSRFLAQTFRGASERIALPASLTKSLKALARREQSTLFMVLLAAFKVLLARYSSCFDIVVGTPIANRPHADLEKLIGFFANTLVIRTDLSQNPSFRTVLARLRKGCLEAYRHQNLPFEKLVENLRPERDSLRHPLVQVLFAFQNAPSRSWELAGLQVDSLPLDSQKVAFDVSFSLREQDERLQGSMTYKIELFDKGTITRMLGHFQSLLESIVKNPDLPISALTLLTEQEHHDLVRLFDAGPPMVRKDFHVHEYFEKQVLKNPDKIAVLCEDQHVTYQQLNGHANQLAQYLRFSGIEPDMKVALFLERSINLVVGILGILKAGGSYVPLDRAFPQERLAFMIKDASIELMLTEKDLLEEASKYQIRHICIDAVDNVLSTQSSDNPMVEVTADNLAYIIFTSGSTGQPKGVGVTHGNVVRLLERTQPWFQFIEQDTWTFFHSHAFDFSVWELFGALLNGGQVVIVPHWVSRAPDLFHELLIHEQVTILNQTPSAFQELIRAEETSRIGSDLALRLVVFGGEALDFQSLKPWVERHGDQVPRLINMYGITETTVHVTYRPLTLMDLEFDATSRIGNPIPDLQVYILDQYQQPVPIGVPGEMYVGGAGVTRGYVNHPDLTSARYIPNPYSQQAGARLYRSGDLARYLPNGDIEYWGRVDHQVKIRGFRIELGEIKTRLVQHPEIREAVVIVREDQLEDKRIVAYLIVADSTTLLIPNLRTYLGKWLPNYMIPSAFVMLSSLPLTSNGKIDLERLPAPELSRESSTQPFEQARTPVEEKLANIWREVLNVAQVGIRDNFFDLGGHSLLLTKLANRVHDTFQIRLPLRIIFDLPTIERMGQAIIEEQVKNADKVTVNRFLSKLSEMTPEQVSELLKGQE